MLYYFMLFRIALRYFILLSTAFPFTAFAFRLALFYFLLRFARTTIAITAAARIIPITTRIIPIMLLASSIPRIWLIWLP